MPLLTCSGTEAPFGVALTTSPSALQGGDGYPAFSPADSCRKFTSSNSYIFVSATEHTCSAQNAMLTNVYPVVRLCNEATTSPFVLSVADGAVLSALIISVWVSAMVFRSFIKAVSHSDGD